MVLVDQMRSVSTAKFSPHRTIGRPHNACAEFLFLLTVRFVDLKFDIEADLRISYSSVDFTLPRRLVKKDILTEILGVDESEISLRTHVFDFAKPFPLDVERLFGAVVVTLQRRSLGKLESWGETN